MPKTITSITLDLEILLAVRNKKDFNLSQFCNEALRKALNIKKTDIPEAENELNEKITSIKVELQLLEHKRKELEEKRKKETSRYEIKEGG